MFLTKLYSAYMRKKAKKTHNRYYQETSETTVLFAALNSKVTLLPTLLLYITIIAASSFMVSTGVAYAMSNPVKTIIIVTVMTLIGKRIIKQMKQLPEYENITKDDVKEFMIYTAVNPIRLVLFIIDIIVFAVPFIIYTLLRSVRKKEKVTT